MSSGTRKHVLQGAAGFGLLGTLLLLLFQLAIGRVLVTDGFRPSPEGLASWAPLQHFSHNAYVMWRLDLVTRLIASPSQAAGLLSATFLFAAGCFVLMSALGDRREWLRAIVTAIAATASLLFLFGLDSVVLGVVAYLPWAIALLSLPGGPVSIPIATTHLLSALVLGALIASSANQLGLIVLGVAWASCLHSGAQHRNQWLRLLLLAAPSIGVLLFAPLPEFPDYPLRSAHLVPSTGVSGLPHALIAPEYPLAVLDRTELRRSLATPSLLLLLVSGACLIFARLSRQRSAAKLSLTATVLAGVLVLDVLPREEFSQILPLATFGRVYPHAIFFALPQVVMAIGVALVVLSAALLAPPLIGIVAVASWALLLGGILGTIDVRPAALQHPERLRPFEHLAGLVASPAEQAELELRMYSPSYAVFRTYGPAPVLELLRRHELDFSSARPFVERLSASHHNEPERLRKTLDHHPKSRWSTGNGAMRGGEWFALSFRDPIPLAALQLDLGQHPTDFPAGLRIWQLPTCDGDGAPASTPPRLVLDPWEGPLRVTEHGYPYFGPQADVRIHFPVVQNVHCLVIQQTGSRPFDWSIAEIRIAGNFARPQRKTRKSVFGDS